MSGLWPRQPANHSAQVGTYSWCTTPIAVLQAARTLLQNFSQKHLEITPADFEAVGIVTPYKAVESDLASLHANPNLPIGMTVTGMVCDVAAGQVTTVVTPFPSVAAVSRVKEWL